MKAYRLKINDNFTAMNGLTTSDKNNCDTFFGNDFTLRQYIKSCIVLDSIYAFTETAQKTDLSMFYGASMDGCMNYFNRIFLTLKNIDEDIQKLDTNKDIDFVISILRKYYKRSSIMLVD